MNHKIISIFSLFVSSASVISGFRPVNTLKTNILKRSYSIVCNKNNASTITAVPSVRSTLWDVFLTVEGNAAIAAVARFQNDFRLINKHIYLSAHSTDFYNNHILP